MIADQPFAGELASHGLVIGKFYPPHVGHHYLIETTARHCRRLSVVVMAATCETILLEDRVRWLRQAHADLPGLDVIGVTDDVPIDFDDPVIWDQHVALVEAALARAAILNATGVADPADPSGGLLAEARVDLVASSEPYGEELARRMGARSLLVDQARAVHPISGTRVRADLVACWEHLRGPVRAGLGWRVAVVGAESTGTTTVARLLAQRINARGGVWADTRWVAEYGRIYTEERLAVQRELHTWAGREGEPTIDDLVWTGEDFPVVASRQLALEEVAAGAGSPLLVCDTDVFATCVWHTRYVTAERLGCAEASALSWSQLPLPQELRRLAEVHQADLYLLTDHAGVPFVQDGLRDGEHLRPWMTREFQARLEETGRRWIMLTGHLEERVDQALSACDNLIEEGRSFADPL